MSDQETPPVGAVVLIGYNPNKIEIEGSTFYLIGVKDILGYYL